MNTKHIILDVENDLGGVFCCYCGKEIGSSYNPETEAYEFKCMCEKASQELQLQYALQKAQAALNNFYEAANELVELTTMKIKRDVYKEYALQLNDMYNDLVKYYAKEKTE